MMHPDLLRTLSPRALCLGSTSLLPAIMLAAAGSASAQNVSALAGPTGGRVIAGAASIAQTPGLTQITQSTDRAAINWQQFNVGSNSRVNFQQPSSSSWTLNRVTGPDPSVIAGRVTANGGVALVNQSGMVFTPGSQVNVASLIASAPNITDQNFMAGKMVFDGAPRPGARVVNGGAITVAQRGLAALVGPEVANKGVIQARMGKVMLAGAETYTLDLAGDGLLSIDVTKAVTHAPQGGTALVTNSGVIRAEGGSVLLTADAASGLVETLVANTGRISAPTIAAGAGSPERTGTIVLRATGGGVQVDGRLSATGRANAGGGRIEVNADRAVTLTQNARLNVSGGTGGGQAFVGTSGIGSNQRMAAQTTVARGALIRADARVKGNGGTVSVNSRDNTNFAGTISARGGAQGGDGGFVETSGQGALTLGGSVDVQAPLGQTGTLLLDPQDILISAPLGTGVSNPVQAGGGTVLAASAPTTGTLTIGRDQIENFNGNVDLQATRNITVSAQIGKKNGGLTMVAQGGLLDVGQAVATSGDLSLTGATVNIRPSVILASFGTITLQSTVGAVTVNAGAAVAAGVRVNVFSQTDFDNSGTLSGGINQAGVVATGTTGNAIEVLAGGDVTNSGYITGMGGGAPITGGGTVAAVFLQAGGTITNTGTITALARSDGTGGNLRLDTAGLSSNINNNAPINGGAIVNDAGGNLSAQAEASLTSNTSVTNNGAIAGGLIAGGQATRAVNLSANTTIDNTGSVLGYGGGQSSGNGNTISAVTLTTANGAITNSGSIQSQNVGNYYGTVSITAGGNNGRFANTGSIAAARNAIVNANTYISNTGSIVASTGRVDLTANGTGLAGANAIDISGGLIGTLSAPPPNPAPTNPGRITITAAQGDINITNSASLYAPQSDIYINAARGGVQFDGVDAQVSMIAGGLVRVDAAASLSSTVEPGAIRFDSVVIQANTLIGHVGAANGAIDLDGAIFGLGRAALLAAPGGIAVVTQPGSSVIASTPGQLPVVIFDTRGGGAALNDIPSFVSPDIAGQAASAQPTQLSQFGAASANASDGVPSLVLDAGQSAVFLLVDQGSVGGSLSAGRLGVQGLGGSASLFGSLGGQFGSGAAALATVSQQASAADAQRYQFNGCAFGSANCVTPGAPGGPQPIASILATVPFSLPNVLADVQAAVNATSSLRNFLVPQPEIVRFRPLRGRLADPDVLLPNVVEQDY